MDFTDTLSKLEQADVLFFCHDVDRGLSLSGQAYSPLLDSVRNDLEERGLKCECVALPFSKLTGVRGYRAPRAMNRSYFFSSLISKFDRRPSNYARVQEGVHARRQVLGLYRRILDKVRPSLVISIGAKPEMAQACRLAGIRHAELMHGMGYSEIPWGWATQNIIYLPTDVLALDDKTVRVMAPLRKAGVAVHRFAHPFLKRFIGSKLQKLPAEWITQPPIASRAFSRRIVFSLTWGYAGDNPTFSGILENGLFPSVIQHIVEQTSDTIFWSFRLHPVQIRQHEKYAAQLASIRRFCATNANTEWEWASTVPLPIALSSAVAHMTMISMSCYDAAAMGIPSMVLCPTTRSGGRYETLFDDLVEKGFVTKSDWKLDAIAEWLERSSTESRSLDIFNEGDDDLLRIFPELFPRRPLGSVDSWDSQE